MGIAIALMIATPAMAQAVTCSTGYQLTNGVCVKIQGGAPLFRNPAVYHGGYFNSPAPIFGGHTVWFSANQWRVGTLHVFNATQEYTVKDGGNAFVHYFNVNHIPNGTWTAVGCVESYMGEVCGNSFVFVK